MPNVSVIIPVYNTSKYLRKCLDSLVNQTYRDIEIITFNDASTDDSLSILEEYARKDNRVKVINSTVNVCIGGRNRGIKASIGKYICLVDSDDWVAPDYVEKLYHAAVAADADIVVCDYYESINDKLKEISLWGKRLEQNTAEFKKNLLLYGSSVWQCIYKREIFLDNDLFFPEHLFYEDAINGVLFYCAKKIAKIDDALYFYRKDNVSTARSINNYRFFERIQTAQIFLNHMKRLDLYEANKAEIDWAFTKMYYLNTINGCLTKFKPIEMKKILEVQKSFKKIMPDYRSNIYYQRDQTSKQKMFWNLMHYAPSMASRVWQMMGR